MSPYRLQLKKTVCFTTKIQIELRNEMRLLFFLFCEIWLTSSTNLFWSAKQILNQTKTESFTYVFIFLNLFSPPVKKNTWMTIRHFGSDNYTLAANKWYLKKLIISKEKWLNARGFVFYSLYIYSEILMLMSQLIRCQSFKHHIAAK